MSRGEATAGRDVAEWLRTALRRRFGVDARALAALRVGLGLLLLADLAVRSLDLVAHYTDAGALPRSALAEVHPAFASLSLHALSGAVWFQAALFLAAAAFAVALLVGYRTRIATAAALVLLLSLQLRNPLVLNAGDSLLAFLLVWALFLPLGDRWSVDAVRGAGFAGRELPVTGVAPEQHVADLATAALLLQVVVVYVVNAALKLRGKLWRSGEAIRYVFGLDHLTVVAGDLLAGIPAVLVAADRLWLAMVVASPLLLLLTGRARTAFAAAFVGAHLGMALTLRLGLFPLVSVVALLPFLHAGVWDALEERTRGSLRGRLVRLAERVDWALPRATLTDDVRLPNRPVRLASSGLVAVLLALLLVWNVASVGLVGLPAGATSTVDPEERRWDMFAPEPRTDDGWYVVPGELESGERVDAFRGGEPTWNRPPELAATFPSHRWFVYLLDLRAPANALLRDDFAAYLCRRWNERHEDALVSLALYYVEEPVRLDGPEERRRVELGEHSCAR